MPRNIMRTILPDRRGTVAIMTALLLPIIAGALAMVSDIAYWRYRAMIVQKAADSAAVSIQFSINGNVSSAKTAISLARLASAEAVKNGWFSSMGTSTLNRPPLSGRYAGNSNYIEIILTENEPRLFSGIWTTGNKTLTGRAVATASMGPTGSGCLLALSASASQAFYMLNNAAITNPDCDVVANSTSATGIYLNNNATIAGWATTPGNVFLANGAATGGNMVGVNAQPDPYASVISLPQSGAGPCTDSSGALNLSGSQTVNLSPGHWCQGWTGKNNITFNLSPGIYYIDSVLNLQNGIVINGNSGVTLVIGAGVTPNWGNNVVFNLVAPTSGPTSGIVFTQYSDDTGSQTYAFSNNVWINYTGDIYLKKKIVSVQNNGYLNPMNGTNGCGRVIADQIQFYNNAVVGNNCAGTGVLPFGSRGASWAAHATGPQKSGASLVE